MLEEGGLRVVASKRIHMSKEQAEGFYAVHKERPFFGELVELHDERPGRRAGAGRRKRHAAQPRHHGRHQPRERRPARSARNWLSSIEANTVHGSDSDENAAIEIAYFFKPEEIVG
jgi:nucleoside-diphosphate kinase